MNFLIRQRFPLLVVVVLALGCVFVTFQYALNESRHVKKRETLIHLERTGQTKPAEHLYQTMIQELSGMPDHLLLADFQRLELMDLREKQDPASLLTKYRTAVKNVLERRTKQRVDVMFSPDVKE